MASHLFKGMHDTSPVLVIGLGRFGSAVALALVQRGREVLAVDADPVLVHRYADELTHVVQADATEDEALAQLGVSEFDHAVVAIGADVEASVLVTLSLAQAKVKNIWAKAITLKHGEILDRVGAHRVVYPERTVGQQVAHLIVGGMSQYLELGDGFAIASTSAPPVTWNQTLGESAIRSRHAVTVVGVMRGERDFIYARPDTVVEPNDDLIVAGAVRKVEMFCALTID